MEKKVALVLALMLLASTLVSAEETPTIGQRLDSATADVTSFFNDHALPAVDSVSSTAKSIFNWFGDKAKEWGL
ncbi:hypothetical protein V5N11_008603 [Cardamine amara subsp. amara]|uniref:Uncharacterized protein n=1 Tax=Cardamine amara subsp. amara TaxID=228776 RepID=A0ABD1AWM4_CARAN